MKKEQEIPQLISLKEVSKRLSVHPNTLRNWEKKGIITSVRIGVRGDRKYKVVDIMKILQGQIEKLEKNIQQD